jgi:hypothetical protein
VALGFFTVFNRHRESSSASTISSKRSAARSISRRAGGPLPKPPAIGKPGLCMGNREPRAGYEDARRVRLRRAGVAGVSVIDRFRPSPICRAIAARLLE